MKKDIQVYAIGGCGLKLAHTHLITVRSKGFASPSIAVLDSSRSDVDVDISNHQISHHFIQGADGLGKDRVRAVKIIAPEIGPFLDNHQPGKVNIVVSSLSGGTGSVGSLILIKELLSRGEHVIAMLVANTTNEREAINSLSAFGDLNKIVKETGRPLPIMYFENTTDVTDYHAHAGLRSSVNRDIQENYRRLCCMFSGDHVGIDSKDVSNFLNYTNVSKTPPKVIELYTETTDVNLEAYKGEIETLMFLAKDLDYQAPTLLHRYEVKGNWSSDILSKHNEDDIEDVLLLATTDAVIPDIINRLKTSVQSFKEAASAARRDPFSDFENDDAEDVGI